MPHSQPKNWQAELGLKQMLNLGVGKDGQQQDSQCPDAAGGLCVQDSQHRQGNGQDSGGGAAVAGRSDTNGQPERRKRGWGNSVACKLQRALS